MTDTKYPAGIIAFNKHAKAPDFVVGSLVITPNDLFQWCKDNPQYMSDYNGKKQVRLQLKNGTKGLYVEVDTYKKDAPATIGKNDDLPF